MTVATPEQVRLEIIREDLKRAGIVVRDDTDRNKAKNLVEKGWQVTYATLFGQSFVDVLAPHHEDSISWHWNARIDILEGRDPDYYADFPIFSRGHMKSTLARRISVVDAFLSFAYGVGGYCLYFSGTEDKTSKHALSISQLLQSDAIQQYAPPLARVKKSEEGGRSLGWKATFIYTDAGFVFHFGSLQAGLAGGNVDDLRPTLIVPDDIDNRKDSIAETGTNLKAFTNEILPMGATGTLTYFAQNLISRNSIMSRIHKGTLRVLTNRRPSQPIPAVEGLEIEYRTIGGISKPFIINGRATWEKGMPIKACQEELQRIGEDSFRIECQHEVDKTREGLIISNYNDNAHVISQSEFASIYGTSEMPQTWAKWNFNDWAKTKTEFHANVGGWITTSSQNTRLPGHVFIFHPMSFGEQAEIDDVAERFLESLSKYAYDTVEWGELMRQVRTRSNAEYHAPSWKERIEYERSVIKNTIPRYSVPMLEQHNYQGGVNSHDRNDVRDIFNSVYGFRFIAANPRLDEKLTDINSAFKVDYNLDNPFRPHEKGYTRWHIVVPDDFNAEPYHIEEIPSYLTQTVKGYVHKHRFFNEIRPPKPYPDAVQPHELKDDDLMRYQFSNWRYIDPKLTETGERIDIPLKVNDDFGQCLQMFFLKNLLTNVQLSTEEKIVQAMPEALRPSAIAQIPDGQDKINTMNASRVKREQITKQLNKPQTRNPLAQLRYKLRG